MLVSISSINKAPKFICQSKKAARRVAQKQNLDLRDVAVAVVVLVDVTEV